MIFAIPATDIFLIGRKTSATVEALARAVGGRILDGEPVLSSRIYEYRDDTLTAFARVEVVDGRINGTTAGKD